MAARSALPYLAALAGIAVLALLDAAMKGASLAIGAYSAALLRTAIGVVLVAPVWLARGGRWPRPEVRNLHLKRGVLSAFMGLTFFYALTKLPIAEAIAISFVAPLIALYLAAILLHETVPPRAILASMLGFGGTLVIVGGKIGRETMTQDSWLGLASLLVSALLYAYNFILIRRQSQVAGPLEIATFHTGVSTVVLGVAAPFALTLPGPFDAALLLLAAVLTILGSIAIAYAYARAEAQALVPLEYSAFLWASLLGWLFFAETVRETTIAGTGLIVAGCWLAARRKPASETHAATSG